MDKWTSIIKPADRFFNLGLREVWEKKYLLWLFVKRDIEVKFKQTVFGFAWYIIAPLVSTAIYVVIFGRIAGIPTDEIPQPLFYLSGICLWNYFSQCLNKISATFSRESGLYGKVYFPRLISPISVIFSELLKFSIQLVLFIAACIYYASTGYGLHPNAHLLLFPVIVAAFAALALGLGLIVSSLTTKYRDLNNLFGVFVSLWMYATPIVFPMSFVTDASLKKIMMLNPAAPLVEAFKYGALGVGQFSWGWLGYSLGLILVTLVIGLLLFNRKQKFFIDTI